MKKKLKFIWIDDDPDRKPISQTLSKRLKVEIEFISVKGENVQLVLEKLLKRAQPDLLLIDHIFDKAIGNIVKTGFLSAALIKEKWVACPIVCITGIDKVDFQSQQHSLYQETFELSNISSHDAEILSIAESFKLLKSRKFKNVDALLRLLNVPEDDLYKLTSILPQEIKENIAAKSLPIHLCKWIRKTLFARPGFLYNRLWISTLLGIKESSFHKVENLFATAKYDGLFNNDSEARWWKSEVLNILSQKVQSFGLPWEIGRELPKLRKTDYSKDYVCDDDFPETVAFVDESVESKQVQIRIQYTEPHPGFEDMLFFETIRIMKGQDND